MQANKATPEVMNDLRQWLENPKTGASAVLDGAKDDLKWLNSSKDLSSVRLGESEQPPSPSKEKTEGGGQGKSAFAALFNCAGKRK